MLWSKLTGATSAPKQYVALGVDTAPYIHAYTWSSASGFGTKYANPSSLPANGVYGLKFSASGDAIVHAVASAPFIGAYAWSSASGFGAKYADPSTLPNDGGNRVAFTEIA